MYYGKMTKELENLYTQYSAVWNCEPDFYENAEYDEAKNEQAQVEERIVKLENMLRKAVIIDE